MCNLEDGWHNVLICNRLTKWHHIGSLVLSIAFFSALLPETHAAQVNDTTQTVQSVALGTSGMEQGILLAKHDRIDVQLDRAKIVRLPAEARTVVVGNPIVVDISTLRNDIGVLTAKSYGTTNLVVLSEKGEVLLEAIVNVIAPNENFVVVQRGLERETYSCSPTCQPLIQLGDGTDYFGKSSQQVSGRNDLAVKK